MKVGAVYQQTFLEEKDSLGIVDPTLLPAHLRLSWMRAAILLLTPCAILAPFDLTRGRRSIPLPRSHRHQGTALYIQDTITKGSWSFNLGLRGDFYNGLATQGSRASPGSCLQHQKTNTVLRISYARVLETPFNENLVLSSTGCANLY